MFGQLFYAAVMAIRIFLRPGYAATFAVALVAHGVISGSLWTVGSSLGQRLVATCRNSAEIGSAGGILINLVGIVPRLLGGRRFLLDSTHHEYRYTFLIGLVFSVLTFVSLAILIPQVRRPGWGGSLRGPGMSDRAEHRGRGVMHQCATDRFCRWQRVWQYQ